MLSLWRIKTKEMGKKRRSIVWYRVASVMGRGFVFVEGESKQKTKKTEEEKYVDVKDGDDLSIIVQQLTLQHIFIKYNSPTFK